MIKRYKITDYFEGTIYTFLDRKRWNNQITLLRYRYKDECIFTICKNHPRHMVITKR